MPPNPYNQWNCSFIPGAGVDMAPIAGMGIALDVSDAPTWAAGTDIGDFQIDINRAAGTTLPSRYATSGVYHWYNVEVGGVWAAKGSALTALVNQRSGDALLAPGIYTCTFDTGDCLDLGGTPSACKASHAPKTILAYDPGCVKKTCEI